MGWDLFRRRVLRVMNKPPKSSDEVAKIIAQSYDSIIRTPQVSSKGVTGDLINKHTLQRGNKDLLERWITTQFRLQSLSLVPLEPNLPTAIANGFPKYWTGGTMKPGLPPSLLPIGNISSMTVSNPGQIVTQPLPQTKSAEEFVEQIITLGKKHLLTVGGIKIVDVPSINGVIPTPVPWLGYRVLDEKEENTNDVDKNYDPEATKDISIVSLPLYSLSLGAGPLAFFAGGSELDEYLKEAGKNYIEFYKKISTDIEFKSKVKSAVKQDVDAATKISKFRIEYFSNNGKLSLSSADPRFPYTGSNPYIIKSIKEFDKIDKEYKGIVKIANYQRETEEDEAVYQIGKILNSLLF